jgi:RNA polymerase sigma-B factor
MLRPRVGHLTCMGGTSSSTTVEPRGDARSERTRELLARARTATGAERLRLLDQVVLENVCVARSVARRFRDRGVPLEDLEQVACLGLVAASRRFDPDRAEDFLTFAVPTMTGQLKRYFRDAGWAVRPPRHIQEIQARINQDAQGSAGGHESVEEMATRLDLPVRDVADAQLAFGCFAPTSLDAPAGGADNAAAKVAFLVDEAQTSDWNAAEARVLLGALAKELEPRERLILYLRFVEERTQAEIGQELGVTQMQVSRLLANILADMRARLERSPRAPRGRTAANVA